MILFFARMITSSDSGIGEGVNALPFLWVV